MRGKFSSFTGVLLLAAVVGLSLGCNSSLTAGPPGPIIDVDPDPSNGNVLDWSTTPDGGTTKTKQSPTGGPIFTTCQFREDFIGEIATMFNGCLSGTYETSCTSEAPGLTAVMFVNPTANIYVTVEKKGGDKITWQYLKRTTSPIPEMCTLTKKAETPGYVPNEFGGFTEIWNITNRSSPVALTDFQMQVELEEEPE